MRVSKIQPRDSRGRSEAEGRVDGAGTTADGAVLQAQVAGDVLGVHDLGPGSKSPITGARSDSCAYCHAPHSGLSVGLWNQKLTTQNYTTYASNTAANIGTQPILGPVSNQCLSCHDGTVAVGTTVVYGQITTRGSMYAQDVFGSNMQSSHPFSMVLPLKDNVDLVSSLAASGKTADPTGAVKLIKGNVECTSCHDPHVQTKDLVSHNFLVRTAPAASFAFPATILPRTMGGHVQSAARLVRQRACFVHKQDFAADAARQLHHGCCHSLHLPVTHRTMRRSGSAVARPE